MNKRLENFSKKGCGYLRVFLGLPLPGALRIVLDLRDGKQRDPVAECVCHFCDGFKRRVTIFRQRLIQTSAAYACRFRHFCHSFASAGDVGKGNRKEFIVSFFKDNIQIISNIFFRFEIIKNFKFFGSKHLYLLCHTSGIIDVRFLSALFAAAKQDNYPLFFVDKVQTVSRTVINLCLKKPILKRTYFTECPCGHDPNTLDYDFLRLAILYICKPIVKVAGCLNIVHINIVLYIRQNIKRSLENLSKKISGYLRGFFGAFDLSGFALGGRPTGLTSLIFLKSSSVYKASCENGLHPARSSRFLTVAIGNFNFSAISETVNPFISNIIGILRFTLNNVYKTRHLLNDCLVENKKKYKNISKKRHFVIDIKSFYKDNINKER